MSLEPLLQLQDLDVLLDQLAHRRANLAERTAAAACAATVAAIEQTESEVGAATLALDARLSALEGDVATLTTRRDRLSASLYDGSVTAHKDLEAIQHELENLGAQIGGLEDAELELMEEQESLRARRADLGTRRREAETDLDATTGALADAERSIDQDAATTLEQRTALAATLPEDVVARYESMRRSFEGIAVARFEAGRCLGCHMQMSATDAAHVVSVPVGEAVECPNCGRLMIR